MSVVQKDEKWVVWLGNSKVDLKEQWRTERKVVKWE
jgi:hypothetical protein